jgi:hypothetical protein
VTEERFIDMVRRELREAGVPEDDIELRAKRLTAVMIKDGCLLAVRLLKRSGIEIEFEDAREEA